VRVGCDERWCGGWDRLRDTFRGCPAMGWEVPHLGHVAGRDVVCGDVAGRDVVTHSGQSAVA